MVGLKSRKRLYSVVADYEVMSRNGSIWQKEKSVEAVCDFMPQD